MNDGLVTSVQLLWPAGLIFISLAMLGWFLLQWIASGWRWLLEAFAESVEQRLSGLFLFTNPRKLLRLYLLCLVAVPGLSYLMFDAFFAAGVSFLVLLATPKVILLRLEQQRRKRINEALPDVLAQVAGGMQAGASFNTAIETITLASPGPIGQELSLFLAEQKLGTALEDALENLGERTQSEDIDLMVTAALIAHDVGGNLSAIFQRLSVTLRRKLEMEGKIKALTSQGVLQGWVVSLLPFAILIVLWFIETDAVTRIYTTALGWLFLATILCLQLIGGAMIRKIVTINV